MNLILTEIEKQGLTEKVRHAFLQYIEMSYIENHLTMIDFLMKRYSLNLMQILKEPVGRLRLLFSIAMQTKKVEPDSQLVELMTSFLYAMSAIK